jgi:MFS family permease
MESNSTPFITRIALRVTVWVAVLTVSACLFRSGIKLRHWAWENTQNVRFLADVNNAYRWGSDADQNGLFNMYRRIVDDYGVEPPREWGLDYSPLRLTIVTLWAHWVNRNFDGNDQFDPDISYDFHRPLLMVNAAFEVATVVALVLVVGRMRQIVCGDAPERSVWKVLVLAIVALLAWFNPAFILNDCWPQWDVWILPFFVLAIYFGMRDWWFSCGVMLGIGAMLKGQILFVAPVFLIWPLLGWRWLSVGRVIAGLAVAVTAIAIPWTLTGKGDVVLVCAGAVVAGFALVFRKGWKRPVFQFLAVVFFVVPVWLTPKLLSGDLAWLKLAYVYGSNKHPALASVGTSNLAALLQEQWNWQEDDTVHLPIPFRGGEDWPLRNCLVAMFATGLAVCGIAAAVQWRRRDRRFLLAIYAPWVLWFALMPNMNNRYLFYAAGLFPLLVAVGPGMTLLGLLISAACCAMMGEVMCRFGNNADPTLSNLTHGMYPGLAFLVLMIAGVFVFESLNFRRQRTGE